MATRWRAGSCSSGLVARSTGAHHSLADELLTPSVIYTPALLALAQRVDVRAMAHVTGGGLTGNLPRVLPRTCDAELDRRAWETPRIFTEIQRAGEVADDEMVSVFNLGIGMVVVVPADDGFRTLDLLRAHGHKATQIGQIVPGEGIVRLGPSGPSERSELGPSGPSEGRS